MVTTPQRCSLKAIPTSWITAVTQMFEDAAIQNVTVCIASGDTGAQSKLFDGLAHVQYPASDPWVLAAAAPRSATSSA